MRKSLTVRETAERIGVSEPTIRRYLNDGVLNGRRIGPRLGRVDPASIADLIGE